MAEFRKCPDCGSEHLGPACGMSFRQRLMSVNVDRAGFDTSEKHNYFDGEAVDEMFGADSREQMMEETKGIGAVKLGRDGRLYKRGDGRPEALTQKETALILDDSGREGKDAVDINA